MSKKAYVSGEDPASDEGVSPRTILQNRQSAIVATLPWLAVDDGNDADALVAAFARWAADERVSAAAVERARERSMRLQAGAGATVVGVLVDLAELAVPVVVSVAGVHRSGRIVAAGEDFCVLDPGDRARPSLVVTRTIAAVWPGRGSATPAGERPAAVALSLPAALSLLAEERAPVRLVLPPSQEVSGELVSVGDDVVTIAGNGPSGLVHVPVAAVGVCDLI